VYLYLLAGAAGHHHHRQACASFNDFNKNISLSALLINSFRLKIAFFSHFFRVIFFLLLICSLLCIKITARDLLAEYLRPAADVSHNHNQSIGIWIWIWIADLYLAFCLAVEKQVANDASASEIFMGHFFLGGLAGCFCFGLFMFKTYATCNCSGSPFVYYKVCGRLPMRATCSHFWGLCLVWFWTCIWPLNIQKYTRLWLQRPYLFAFGIFFIRRALSHVIVCKYFALIWKFLLCFFFVFSIFRPAFVYLPV